MGKFFKKIGKGLKKAGKGIKKGIKDTRKTIKKVKGAGKKIGKGALKAAKAAQKVAKKATSIAAKATDFEHLGNLVAGGVCSGPLKGKTCNAITKNIVRVGGSVADFATGGQITATNEALKAANKLVSGDLKGLANQAMGALKDKALEVATGGLSEYNEAFKDVTGTDVTQVASQIKSVKEMANQVSGYVDDPVHLLTKQALGQAEILANNVGYSPRNVINQLQDTLPLSVSQNMSTEQLLNSSQAEFLKAIAEQGGDYSTPGHQDMFQGSKYLSDLGDYSIKQQLDRVSQFKQQGETNQSIAAAYRQFNQQLAPPTGGFANPFGGFRGFQPQRSFGVLPTQFGAFQQGFGNAPNFMFR